VRNAVLNGKIQSCAVGTGLTATDDFLNHGFAESVFQLLRKLFQQL
jgi:hypothetical protein